MSLVLDVVFALAKGIPQLDGLVTGARNDLTVVCAEADGENIRGMADETACCAASVQVPETEGMVPRSREGELAVGGNDNVGNKVVVAVEDTPCEAERVLIAGELPDDDSFICRRLKLHEDSRKPKYLAKQSGSCPDFQTT